MTVRITKLCRIRLNGEVKTLKARETIHLPDDKAQRLIAAGYAEIEVIATYVDEYQALCRKISELDPKGDCWNWIQKHHPELWKEHITAFRKGEIALAGTTFKQMTQAFNAQQ